MKFIKKIWILAFSIISLLSLNFGACYVRTPWPTPKAFSWDSTPIMSGEVVDNVNSWAYTFSDRLKWIVKIPQKGEYSNSLLYVTTLIQVLINWLLWIWSFVALVYLLYCGFLVLSSGTNDKNASKGKKWISTAAIALVWIWLSWLIISVMLWFINGITSGT